MMFELRGLVICTYIIVLMATTTRFVKSDTDDRCINPENVFLEELQPVEQYVPINTSVTYDCSVNNSDINWAVEVWSHDSSNDGQSSSVVYNIAVPGEMNILRDRGITAEPITNSGPTRSSRLTVFASKDNNGTIIICRTILSNPSLPVVPCDSRVTLLVYDRPSPPSGLMVETVNIQVVKVLWTISTPNVTGSNLASTINITNLNHSTYFFEELTEFHYIFNASIQESFSPCDHYQFTVTAINGAGASSPEDTICTLPSLPEISSVSSSLTHVVEKNEDGRIVIQVNFGPAEFCEDYPVMNYSVVLYTSMGTEFKQILSRGERLEALFGPSYDVQENIVYLQSVTAVNSEGNVTSISKECFTSDLKKLNLTRKGNRTLCVQCTFINGSDALGCKIVLVSNNSLVGNVSRTLYRSNSELILQGELNVSEDFSYYHSVFGFDVESNNSTSDLAIPGDLNITSNSACSPQTKDNGNTVTVPLEGVIVGAVIGVITIVCVASSVSVFLGACFWMYKRDKRKVKNKSNTFNSDRYEDSPSSLNKPDNVVREETQEAIVLPLYDQPEKLKSPPEGSVFLSSSSPKQYHSLTHDDPHHSHMTSPVVQQVADTSGLAAEYSQLDESSVQHHYAVLESNPQEPFYAEPSTVAARHRGASNNIATDPNAPPLPPALAPMYNEIGREEEPSSSSSGRTTNWPYSSSSTTNPPSSGTDIL